MALICMVALVKHNHVELVQLHQPVHQDVIQLFLRKNEHIESRQLHAPVLVLLVAW